MDCYMCDGETLECLMSCYTDKIRGYDHVMICNNCLLSYTERHYNGSPVHRLAHLYVTGEVFGLNQ